MQSLVYFEQSFLTLNPLRAIPLKKEGRGRPPLWIRQVGSQQRQVALFLASESLKG